MGKQPTIGWKRWMYLWDKQGYVSADIFEMRGVEMRRAAEQQREYAREIEVKIQRAKDEKRLAQLLAVLGK